MNLKQIHHKITSRHKGLLWVLVLLMWTVILAYGLSEGVAAQSNSDLSYAEGGPITMDPGQNTSHTVYYIDQENGDDSNTGTRAKPWKTLTKVEISMESADPGTHYLLRRGQTWKSDFRVSNVEGADGARFVLGAYGSIGDDRPKIAGVIRFDYSSYVMIRDLEVAGDLDADPIVNGAISLHNTPHNFIVYNNIVHGSVSNAISAWKGASKIVFARNFVYDVASNDALLLHQIRWGDPENQGDIGNHHWIIDNTVIGNDGMEEGVDVATEIAEDVKVIGNKIQGDGENIFGNGDSHKTIAMLHQPRYYWVVGNTSAGSSNNSVKLGGGAENQKAQISGNVIYNGTKEVLMLDLEDASAFHNTVINRVSSGRATVIMHSEAENVKLHDNLFWTINKAFTVNMDVSTAISESDRNFYHASSGPLDLDSLSLSDWISTYGIDTNSVEGSLDGISVPGSQWDDPREWEDPDFWDHFIPSSSWSGNKGSDTPGAFDSEGNRLGMIIEPIDGLSLNDGYGWEGTPLVAALLEELGILFMDSASP